MNDAPKKIWAHGPTTFDEMDVWTIDPVDRATVYIRGDIHEAVVAERDKLLETLNTADELRTATMLGYSDEIERLEADNKRLEREVLISAMQDACRNYLEPTTYSRRSPGGMCKHDAESEMPSRFHSPEARAAVSRRRDEVFIQDIIHFLDSPEWETNVRGG